MRPYRRILLLLVAAIMVTAIADAKTKKTTVRGGLGKLSGARARLVARGPAASGGTGGSSGVSSQIAYGNIAAVGQFPFMAVLLDTGNFLWGCGGSLIRPNVVLTAAHCLFDENGAPADPVAVALGVRSLRGDVPGSHEIINVAQVVRHPLYDPSALVNDLGLLILEGPSTHTPIALANATWPLMRAGAVLYTAGFGATESSDYSMDLRYASVPYIPYALCGARMRAIGLLDPVPPTDICAGGALSQTDSCPGDSGGPLLRYVNGKPVLVGVVSYGPDWPCGTAGSVGGYMSVAKMNGWVQRQLARLRV